MKIINLNKHRIDFGKGDVGIGVIGNTTDSAQLAFYNQSARPIHILKNPDQNPGFEPRILIWILEYMDGTCTLIIKCQLCGICSVTDDTNAYIPFSKIYSMFI